MTDSDPPLDNARHLRYWKRCLRSVLPTDYTANDSTRMTFGCFIIGAIDLLTPPSVPSDPLITPTDRRLLREWVLACQHPGGGFAGAPSHVLPQTEPLGAGASHDERMRAPGNPNVAATYFALQLLPLLAEGDCAEDAYKGVDREATLRWLRALQRPNGSFGEVRYEMPDEVGRTQWVQAGGGDMRYCYLAAGIRWILRGDLKEGEPGWVEDIDVDALAAHIKRGQTYDGGFAENDMGESHAGYAYCALASLSLLDRPSDSTTTSSTPILTTHITNTPSLLRWLSSRPFPHHPDPSDSDSDDGTSPSNPTPHSLHAADPLTAHIGYNGRCNKAADTCYTWWTAGSLAILSAPSHTPAPGSRRFLLDRTQHAIGGFSKYPGGKPDLYHAYLGLAALAVMGEGGLREVDAALCTSVDTVRKMVAGRRGLLKGLEARARDEAQAVERQKGLMGMGQMLVGREVAWLDS